MNKHSERDFYLHLYAFRFLYFTHDAELLQLLIIDYNWLLQK